MWDKAVIYLHVAQRNPDRSHICDRSRIHLSVIMSRGGGPLVWLGVENAEWSSSAVEGTTPLYHVNPADSWLYSTVNKHIPLELPPLTNTVSQKEEVLGFYFICRKRKKKKKTKQKVFLSQMAPGSANFCFINYHLGIDLCQTICLTKLQTSLIWTNW